MGPLLDLIHSSLADLGKHAVNGCERSFWLWMIGL
jgi:hypothetical protein